MASQGARKQRPISSFFFKLPQKKGADAPGALSAVQPPDRKPAEAAGQAGRQDLKAPVGKYPEHNEIDDSSTKRPQKRAKHDASDGTGVTIAAGGNDEVEEVQGPADLQAEMLSADTAPTVHLVSLSPASQRSRLRRAGGRPQPPQDMHERFQKKLVEGTESAMGYHRPGAREIQPQKHTPLELQVVELKKRYPGFLLVIEGASGVDGAS